MAARMGTAEAREMRNSGARAWTLAALMDCAGVQPIVPSSFNLSIPLSCLTDDSRKTIAGSCFVAVRGSVDGHDYIEAAIRGGAVAIVAERPQSAPAKIPCVQVAESREALAKLSAAWFGLRDESKDPGLLTGARCNGPGGAEGGGYPDRNRLTLIGVTGTNGKSTVSWMTRAILQAAGCKAALLGTIEYDLISRKCSAPLTTPGAIDLCANLAEAQSAGADFAVMEVSSHALDQRRTDGLNFAAAIFTNLTGDHLDYHGSMEAYLAAKRRLFDGLGKQGAGVVNLDDPAAERMIAANPGETFTFGLHVPNADVASRIYEMDRSGTRFTLQLSDRLLERHQRMHGRRGDSHEAVGGLRHFGLAISLVGRHNVSNALAAATAALAMGIAPAAIRRGLEAVQGVPGRLENVAPPDCPFSVLVDYAHTDDALKNVLTAVRPVTPGRILCVFGCGGNRDRSKRPRMAAVAERFADRVIVTSDNPRKEDPLEIIADILGGFSTELRRSAIVEPDRRAAIAAAIALAEPGDTVLIAGKGHEDYQLVGEKVLPFDDAKVARDCLNGAPALT